MNDYWCPTCGESLQNCDSRQWCQAARHRSNVKFFRERMVEKIHDHPGMAALRFLPVMKISSKLIEDAVKEVVHYKEALHSARVERTRT